MGTKLHHLMADTDLFSKANGNAGQIAGQLNNPSSARSCRVSLTRIRAGLKWFYADSALKITALSYSILTGHLARALLKFCRDRG